MGLVALLGSLAATAVVPTFLEKPCADERIQKVARCGTVTVPENRQLPNGRTIALNVIVVPAKTPSTNAPPLFDIDGGPGLPVTKNAEFFALISPAFSARRDVVMVDQRGTGGSSPLHCAEFSEPAAAYQPIFPAEAVARCRKSLEVRADLTMYGTREAIADLDDVRAALGYEKLDLFGLSYGTTVALRYLDTYPQRVRAAVLMGVAPPAAMPPKSHAVAAEAAIRSLFAACAREPTCGATFDPVADVDRARARLTSISGAPSQEIFFEKFRSLMYSPDTARRIPYILNKAANGDLSPFYAATKPQRPSVYADGMFLSVICSEAMALMDFGTATAASKLTIFGDYRLRRQKEACAEWPTARTAANHLRPVVSNAAVLIISGELDPVTPPAWAQSVASTLPNSKHIIIPGSGHIIDGMTGIETCLDPIIASFLDTGDAKTIDAGCVREMRAPPFVTSDEQASPRQP
jgi:pimeloyl-ACP methyl ester carboxylesterase